MMLTELPPDDVVVVDWLNKNTNIERNNLRRAKFNWLHHNKLGKRNAMRRRDKMQQQLGLQQRTCEQTVGCKATKKYCDKEISIALTLQLQPPLPPLTMTTTPRPRAWLTTRARATVRVLLLLPLSKLTYWWLIGGWLVAFEVKWFGLWELTSSRNLEWFTWKGMGKR